MNIKNWTSIDIEYGKDALRVKVPPYCRVLKMGHDPALAEPAEKIEDALSNPIESPRIEDIVASYKKEPPQITVAVTVSDNTRPVPYSSESEEGFLFPLLKRLEKAGN